MLSACPPDLARAREWLTYGHGVAVVKDGRLIGLEDGHGVAPFVRVAQRLGIQLRGTCLADRVVGRAVALACVAAEVAAVHGELMSERAIVVLEAAGIPVSAGRVVPGIENRTRTGLCPTEMLVGDGVDPAEALPLLA